MNDLVLPNLLVIGVPKAGTGSLFAYLTQHPAVFGADEKEVGYFNFFNPARHTGPPPPVSAYAAHFAGWSGQRYRMEATPTYSYGGEPVIEAVQRVLGDPRLILSLRDPVERVWSAYTFQRSLGNITGISSFEQYVEICERRRLDGIPLVPRDRLHGLHIGFYADYLGAWLAAFGSDLRVVFADELAARPAAVLGGLFEWLELDSGPARTLDVGHRNVTRAVRSPRVAHAVFSAKRAVDRVARVPTVVRGPLRRTYERLNAGRFAESLTPAMRHRLQQLYRESNQAAARVLRQHGYRELPAWLQA